MTFPADSALVDVIHPSPNVEPRRPGFRVDMLLLHYTGLPTMAAAIDVLSRVDCKVSCHYVLDTDGRIVQMVPEDLRAWHAGVSVWAGVSDINSCSIGIEIQNVGHAAGYPEFPDRQMQALEALAGEICRRHRILPERVLAHSDVAPSRKCDPGEKFDWARLARAGIGHWTPPAPVDPADPGLGVGATGPAVSEAQHLLAEYGYGVDQTGILDPAMEFVVRAFQRHFRPARPDGRLDPSTRTTLERLLATRPSLLVA